MTYELPFKHFSLYMITVIRYIPTHMMRQLQRQQKNQFEEPLPFRRLSTGNWLNANENALQGSFIVEELTDLVEEAFFGT